MTSIDKTQEQPEPDRRPSWLYPPVGPKRTDRCCDSWTPEDGCTAGHTGRMAMSLQARELG